MAEKAMRSKSTGCARSLLFSDRIFCRILFPRMVLLGSSSRIVGQDACLWAMVGIAGDSVACFILIDQRYETKRKRILQLRVDMGRAISI